MSIQVFKRQIVTEKSKKQEADNKFTFEVTLKASKEEIKAAFISLYGITPKSIQTIKIPFKIRPRDKAKKRKALKKAIITLGKKDKFDISKAK